MEAIYLITPTESSVKVSIIMTMMMMVGMMMNVVKLMLPVQCTGDLMFFHQFQSLSGNSNVFIFRVFSTTSNPKIELLTRLRMSISLKVKLF